MRPLFKLFAPLLIIISMLVSGCGSSLPTVKPFKMDIQQGNVVTSKMLLQLKPGMTKSQVRFIMGTPLVVDSFHKDRWDYFYQMRQAGKIVEQRRVILDFEKELLTKVRGDVVPQGTAGAEAAESTVAAAPITVEPKPKETTMLDKLKFWKKDETPVAKAVVADAPLVAPAAVAGAEAKVVIPKVEMAKETTEKTMPEKSMAETSATVKATEEKSWTEKLKFWKKDEKPVAKTLEADAPLVAPAADAAAEIKAAEAKVDTTNAPATSIMNAPIELPDASPPESAAQEAAVIAEPLKTEPLKSESLRTEPFDAVKKPSITGKDSLKSIQSPSQKMLPGKPEPLKPMPAKPAVPSSVFNKLPPEKPAPVDSQLSRPLKPLPLSAKKGEQLIFRMDKTLDLERGMVDKSEAMPKAASPAIELVPNQSAKPTKAEPEVLPPESEPSFFDKMLEKIGF
jgi:outer membrane protein assembly factor BamE